MSTAEPLTENVPVTLAATVLMGTGAARTDVGRRREHNEDQVLVCHELGLFAVADGMGGHDAGDVASAIVAASLQEYFLADAPLLASPPGNLARGARRLIQSVHYSNHEVYSNSGRSAQQGGMGSTVVGIHVAVDEQQLHICHVGDSRCYRLRGDHFELLTEDHSMINEALRLNPNLSPEILKQLPTNVVTRALGTKELVKPDVRTEPLVAGDVYLLCSDGLNGEISDDDIAFAVMECDDLQESCDLLITMANDAGGRDNVSVVLVRIVDASEHRGEDVHDSPTSDTGLDGELHADSIGDEDTEHDITIEVDVDIEVDDDVAEVPAATDAPATDAPATNAPATNAPATNALETDASTANVLDEGANGANVETAQAPDADHEDTQPDAPIARANSKAPAAKRRSQRALRIASATARLDAALDELAAIEEWDDDAPAANPSGGGHLLIVPESEPPPDSSPLADGVPLAPIARGSDRGAGQARQSRPRHSSSETSGAPPAMAITAIVDIGQQENTSSGAPDDADHTRCIACGHRLGLRERFCGMCGRSCDNEVEEKCLRCDKPLLEETRYCVWCGIRHGRWK